MLVSTLQYTHINYKINITMLLEGCVVGKGGGVKGRATTN